MVTFVCWGIPQFPIFGLRPLGWPRQILQDVKIFFFHRPPKKQTLEPQHWSVYFLVGGNSHIFGIFTPKISGRWTHFDQHIFQGGWFNHQPVFVDVFFPESKGVFFSSTSVVGFRDIGTIAVTRWLELDLPVKSWRLLPGYRPRPECYPGPSGLVFSTDKQMSFKFPGCISQVDKDSYGFKKRVSLYQFAHAFFWGKLWFRHETVGCDTQWVSVQTIWCQCAWGHWILFSLHHFYVLSICNIKVHWNPNDLFLKVNPPKQGLFQSKTKVIWGPWYIFTWRSWSLAIGALKKPRVLQSHGIYGIVTWLIFKVLGKWYSPWMLWVLQSHRNSTVLQSHLRIHKTNGIFTFRHFPLFMWPFFTEKCR